MHIVIVQIIMIVIVLIVVITTLLLWEPLPCNLSSETALQPLVWHSEGLSSQGYFFPEGGSFTETGSNDASNHSGVHKGGFSKGGFSN